MTPRPRWANPFAIVALALVAWIVRDALLHGYVLGQGDYLFDLIPWQPYRPQGCRVRMPILDPADLTQRRSGRHSFRVLPLD